MHELHSPHGSGVGPFTQFSERARMRADDVLPQPRGPLNRYAWFTRPADKATRRGSVTCSWPTTSENVAGRYLRYRASATPQTVPVGTDTKRGPRAPTRARLSLLPSGPGEVREMCAARGP